MFGGGSREREKIFKFPGTISRVSKTAGRTVAVAGPRLRELLLSLRKCFELLTISSLSLAIAECVREVVTPESE